MFIWILTITNKHFFNECKSFIKKSLKCLITISTTPFIKSKTPNREVSKYVRLGNTQQSNSFHEIIISKMWLYVNEKAIKRC
jgi:hypothetical protein